MLQRKGQFFLYWKDKLFSHELKIIHYVGSWENKKISDEIRRFDWIRLIDWHWLVNIDWLADIDWLNDLTLKSSGRIACEDLIDKSSNFADFVRFRPRTYARIHQSLPPLMSGNNDIQRNSIYHHLTNTSEFLKQYWYSNIPKVSKQK